MRAPSRASFDALDRWSFMGQAAPASSVAPELAPLMPGSILITDIGDVRQYRRRFFARGNEVVSIGTSGTFPGEGETTLVLYVYGPNAGKAELVLTAQVAAQGWNLLTEDKDSLVYALSITIPTVPPIPADDLSVTIGLVDKAIADAKTQIDVGSDTSYNMALKILDGARAQSSAGLFVVDIFEEMGIISSPAAHASAALFLDLKGQIQNLYSQIQSRGNLIDQFAKGLIGFSAKIASAIAPIFDEDVATAKKIFAEFITLRQDTSSAIKSILALPPDLQKAPQVQNALALFSDRLTTYNQVLANADRIASGHGMNLKDLFGVDTQLSDLGDGGSLMLILTIIGLIVSAISAFAFLYPALKGAKEQKEIQRDSIIFQEYVSALKEYRAQGKSEAEALKHANDVVKSLTAWSPEDLETFGAKAMPGINKAITDGKKLEQQEIEKAIKTFPDEGPPWPILIGAAIVIGIIIYMRTKKGEPALASKRLAR